MTLRNPSTKDQTRELLQQLTSKFRNCVSGFHRFRTISRHDSMVLGLATTVRGPPTRLFAMPPADIAFLRSRPVAVGRDAPRIAKGSDGPAWEAEEERRVEESCGNVRGLVSFGILHSEKVGRRQDQARVCKGAPSCQTWRK